jgi:hypothetical protein
VALFVLLIVGVVVAQTWMDWRDARKDWVVPDWAKGAALAGVVAITLTEATSFASVWLRDSAGQWSAGISSPLFWPEAGFLLCTMGIIVASVRKKRIKLMLALTGILTAAFWLGMTLSS